MAVAPWGHDPAADAASTRLPNGSGRGDCHTNRHTPIAAMDGALTGARPRRRLESPPARSGDPSLDPRCSIIPTSPEVPCRHTCFLRRAAVDPARSRLHRGRATGAVHNFIIVDSWCSRIPIVIIPFSFRFLRIFISIFNFSGSVVPFFFASFPRVPNFCMIQFPLRGFSHLIQSLIFLSEVCSLCSRKPTLYPSYY